MDSVLPQTVTDDPAALARITLTYLWRHHRLPNLSRPTLFTELVQRRKLRDRDPRMPILADKVAVKSLVAARLGHEWIIPTSWSGDTLPRDFTVDRPLVVKSRHGCNQNLIVRDHARDWAAAQHASERWMRRDYGWWLDEWLYADIPRGILIEPMIGTGWSRPIDYKVYVFGGRATHVQVHLDRGDNHRWVIHDRDWRAVANRALSLARPTALPAMLAAAEELATGFDFVRIDFYQPGDQPLFGEISFYPGSGLDPFDPPELDAELGQLWLRAAGSSAWDRQPAESIATGIALDDDDRWATANSA